MFRRLLLVFTDKELRMKLLAVLGLLVMARLLSHVPIPIIKGKDIANLIDNDAVFSLLNTVSGGSYGKLSFVMLGVGPYITASIVMQLLGVIVPKLNEIQKEEGEQGRNKINRWTRMIAVPLAALNSWGILQFLASNNTGGVKIELPEVLTTGTFAQTFPYWFVVILSMVAGSIIMMWIGEIITEYKMGNGISLIILSGIVVRLPSQLVKFWNGVSENIYLIPKRIFENPAKLFNPDTWKKFLWENEFWQPSRSFFIYIAIFLGTLLFVVFINDAVRKLQVVYSRRGHTEGKSRTMDSVKADLPLKVNMAGVLPIIFAVSFILFPSILSRFFLTSNTGVLRDTAKAAESYLSTQNKQVANPGSINLPKKEFLGFYLSGTKDEIESVKNYDTTEGQELFGFTISTMGDTKNSFFEGTPINDVPFLKFNGGNMGFLPQVVIRWNGILAYTFYYFVLIVFFTFFYTSTIAFKTDEVAENLQKSGAYIPGYRPGLETQDYLTHVSNRLNIAGALFLALIAIFPIVFNRYTQVGGDQTLSGIVGGTTMLILVSVTIETLKQIEAQATVVDYDRFVK